MPILDINEIRAILPHRYPFLLVDRIVEMEADRVVGIKQVTDIVFILSIFLFRLCHCDLLFPNVRFHRESIRCRGLVGDAQTKSGLARS